VTEGVTGTERVAVETMPGVIVGMTEIDVTIEEVKVVGLTATGGELLVDDDDEVMVIEVIGYELVGADEVDTEEMGGSGAS
jgi:hypothetical protein